MSSPATPSSPSRPPLSSNAYRVEEIVTTVRVPVVRPKPAFLRVLRLSGGTGETYTMSEIVELVSAYVEEKKLYDEQNPRFVHCENDLLGEALNVTSFAVNQALKLFWENCRLTPDTCLRIKREFVTMPLNSESTATESTETNISCQPASEETKSTAVSATEAAHPSSQTQIQTPTIPLTALQPSTSVTQSDIEEYEEIQAGQIPKSATQETVECGEDFPEPSTSRSVACDETDGQVSPWSCQVMVERHDRLPRQRVRNHDSIVVECTSDSFSVEYELVSSSDAEPVANAVENNDSEESASNHEATEVYVVCQESDIEYLADYSDSDTDSDAELSSEDKWHCGQCQFKNSALYRNCEKCWGIRPDWLPTPSNSGIGKQWGEEDKDEEEEDNNGNVANKLSNYPCEANANCCSRRLLSSVTNPGDPVAANRAQGVSVSVEQDKATSVMLDLNGSQDSAIGSQVSSQEHTEGVLTALNKTNMSIDTNESQKSLEEISEEARVLALQSLKRKDDSDWSDSNEEATDVKRLKKETGLNSDLKSSDPCVICLTRSKTASIIHGKTGHQVCCYRCAKRLKLQRKSCPICRRPIQKVIRNFF